MLTLNDLTRELDDNSELYDMSKEDGDEAGLLTIEEETAELALTIEGLEFRRMFNNPADPLNAFLDIQAGAGGTDRRLYSLMPGGMRKSASLFTATIRISIMEAEQINLIGTQLADLSARTAALRGYL